MEKHAEHADPFTKRAYVKCMDVWFTFDFKEALVEHMARGYFGWISTVAFLGKHDARWALFYRDLKAMTRAMHSVSMAKLMEMVSQIKYGQQATNQTANHDANE